MGMKLFGCKLGDLLTDLTPDPMMQWAWGQVNEYYKFRSSLATRGQVSEQ